MFGGNGDKFMREVVENLGLHQMQISVRVAVLQRFLIFIILLWKWAVLINVLLISIFHVMAQKQPPIFANWRLILL
jgi:hypothetical protein